MKCETCKWCAWPECRRYPPDVRYGFPSINERTWCGEFKDKTYVHKGGWPKGKPRKPVENAQNNQPEYHLPH